VSMQKKIWKGSSRLEGDLEMNSLLEGLKAGKEKICVVGLGYVGLPLAVSLAEHFKVVALTRIQRGWKL
jgi:hypothetical protein